MGDLAKLTAERDALPGGGDGGPVTVIDADEISAEWTAADLAGKRAILKRALGRNWLYIDSAKSGRNFDPTRIRLGPPLT